MTTLALDIGGTKCLAALISDGTVLTEARHETDRGAGADAVRTWIAQRIAEWSGSFDAIGVGFGGPVDFAAQTVVRSVHVPGWDGFPLSEWLREISGVPTVIDNDANVGALGEYAARAGEHREPFVYLTLSTGIGGAIITEGAVLRGAHGMAGEVGHLRVTNSSDGDHAAGVVHENRVCGCGNTGCLERKASGMWLAADHGVPAEVYLADDAAFAHWVDALARGLAPVVYLIDPAVIVLSGGMAAQGDRLTSALAQRLGARNPGLGHPVARIETCVHGGRSVLFGCAELVKGCA